ncbi:RidA family protein [Rhodococcus sp. NPDC055112]
MSEATTQSKLAELGIDLPQPWALPPDVVIPAEFIRIDGQYAFLSGHLATSADGSVTGPFGKVGDVVSLEEAQKLAVAAILSLTATLESTLGDLDRVQQWLRLDGWSTPHLVSPTSQVCSTRPHRR